MPNDPNQSTVAELRAARAWRDAEAEASDLHRAYLAVFGRRGEEAAHPAWKAACRRVDAARAAYDLARAQAEALPDAE